MPRPKFEDKPLTVFQEQVIRARAQGCTNVEIIEKLFGIKKGDDPKYHNAEQQICKWMKHPDVTRIWKEELRKSSLPLMSEALILLRKQMRTKQKGAAWLRNKAANDVLNFVKNQISAEEERSITVQVQGMPEIGTPDDS